MEVFFLRGRVNRPAEEARRRIQRFHSWLVPAGILLVGVFDREVYSTAPGPTNGGYRHSPAPVGVFNRPCPTNGGCLQRPCPSTGIDEDDYDIQGN
jgi:hypothetical protein